MLNIRARFCCQIMHGDIVPSRKLGATQPDPNSLDSTLFPPLLMGEAGEPTEESFALRDDFAFDVLFTKPRFPLCLREVQRHQDR